jgi:hypothetical protein
MEIFRLSASSGYLAATALFLIGNGMKLFVSPPFGSV